MHFLVISGKSGSGKSSALNLLEDEGYTCIDNLPVTLLPALVEQLNKEKSGNIEASPSEKPRVAIGIDARNIDGDLAQLPEILASTKLANDSFSVIFLDASSTALLKRFSETRRRHPLSDKNIGLSEAIALEQEILAPLAEYADTTIDTTHFNLHELRSAVKKLLVGGESRGMAITCTSFGFKYGTPTDADFIFDVRCLPNPHWDPHLRTKTGLNEDVAAFLDGQQAVQEMLHDISSFLAKWIPSFEENNRSYFTIAIGCTGGMHRSVYLTERIVKILRENHHNNVQLRHRQLSELNSK